MITPSPYDTTPHPEELKTKWEKTGLLIDLSWNQQLDMAQLLENSVRLLVEENEPIFPINGIFLPLIRRVMGELMQKEELYIVPTPACYSITAIPFLTRTRPLDLGITVRESHATESLLLWNPLNHNHYYGIDYEAEFCAELASRIVIKLDDLSYAAKKSGQAIYWYRPIGWYDLTKDISIGLNTRYGVSS